MTQERTRPACCSLPGQTTRLRNSAKGVVLGLSSNYADQCAKKNAPSDKRHSEQANPYNPAKSRMLVRDPWNNVAENTVIRCLSGEQPRAQGRSINRPFYYCSSAGDLNHLLIDLRRYSESGSSRIVSTWPEFCLELYQASMFTGKNIPLAHVRAQNSVV